MKKFFKLMLVAMLPLALSLAACDKEEAEPTPTDNNGGNIDPTPRPNPSGQSLSGTAWVGTYNDTYTQDGQTYPAVLTWSLDFLSETNGTLFLELTVAGQSQQPTEISFTYTFNGDGGILDMGNMGRVDYTYSTDGPTITVVLQAGDDNGMMGGSTVFHLRDNNPAPTPVTGDFPAGTRWQTHQETTYHYDSLNMDLPMVLDYELNFNADYTGALVVYISVMGSEATPQSIAFEWNYDAAASAGNFVVSGQPLPFTYDASANTISTALSLNVGEGNSAGGSLVFNRVE